MSQGRARAADIIGTMSTAGWREIEAELDATAQEFKDILWLCDGDDATVLRRQHEAHAAYRFLIRLRARLKDAAQIQEDAEFSPVAY